MKTKINILLLFTFVLLSVNAYSQVTIDGKVYSSDKASDKASDKEPYIGVSVLLKTHPGDSLLAYTYTDSDGKYNLRINGNKYNKLTLAISGIGIKSAKKIIESKTQTVNFEVSEKEVNLKEITVESTKIWSNKDTVNYLVSAFSQGGDLVIGDVLKRIPGIDVSENGSIRYQGREINKFYVENLDLLSGRYGIATNNISVLDISTIQVLENHQPVRALDGLSFSDQAAINLKLKNNAKGIFTIMGALGIGASPALWDNEASGMYFSKQKQNITTYKGNNAGVDLSAELNSFTSSNILNQTNLLSIRMPSQPQIKKRRYLDNNSNAITVNNLIKTKQDEQLNLNLIYYNDHEKRDRRSSTSYLFPNNDVLIMTEDVHSASTKDKLEAEIRFNKNNVDTYFNNLLNVEGIWQRNRGELTTNGDATDQYLKTPVFTATNSLNWIKKQGEVKGYSLSSSMGFMNSAQDLFILPGVYPEIFNAGNAYNQTMQRVTNRKFAANNRFKFLSAIILKNVHIDPELGLNTNYQEMKSHLSIEDELGATIIHTADSLRNDIAEFKYRGGVNANIRYKLDNVSVDINIPIRYNGIHVRNKVMDSNKEKSKEKRNIFFEPVVNLKYDLSSQLELKANYSQSNNLGDIMSLYTGYILSDYRSFNHNKGFIPTTKSQRSTLTMNYKDLKRMFFAGIDVGYNHMKRDALLQQDYNGLLITTTMLEKDNTNNLFSINTRINKGFDFWQILAKLEPFFIQSSAEMIRHDKLVEYNSNHFNVTGSMSAKPISTLLFTYNGSWGYNRSSVRNSDENMPSVRSLANTVSMDVGLPLDINLFLEYEHYYNNASLGNKTMSFADLSLKYTWKSINLSLNVNNILNNDSYMTSFYSGLDSYRQVYNIRSRSVLLKVRMKII